MSSSHPRPFLRLNHRTAHATALTALAWLAVAPGGAQSQQPANNSTAQQAQAQQAARQAQAQQAARQAQALQAARQAQQGQAQQGQAQQAQAQQAGRTQAPTMPQTRTQAPTAQAQASTVQAQQQRSGLMGLLGRARSPSTPSPVARGVTNTPAQGQAPASSAAAVGIAGKMPQSNTARTSVATSRPGEQSSKLSQRPVVSGPPVLSRNFPGHAAPPGSKETQSRNGSIVRTAADGSVIEVRNPRNGVSIQHGLDGSRRIMVEQADRSRVFIPSRGPQYVQHPYTFRGRPMDHRTFVVNGQLTHQFYRPYNYRGTTLDVYAAPRYYSPSVYQWATSRSATPQSFSWTYTTTATPWYNHYRGFFTPEPSYQTPVVWLTDYMLGSTLSGAYNAEGQAAEPLPADATPVTPQVKQLLADEVGRQVKQEADEAADNAKNRDPQPEAASVVHELEDKRPHVFLVSSDLDLVDSQGRRCSMSEGDVVQVVSGAKADSSTVDAVVLANKGSLECGRAAQVQIALTDVQEMQNHMRETIDQGMANTKAGKEGQSVASAFAAAAPPADANAAGEIQQQQAIAAAAEG